MKVRRREIARAGIFGSKDEPQIVTERDLKEIEETFSGIKRAPVVLGHWPRPEDPRTGNVISVTYDAAAQSLSAEIEEDDALAAAVDAGYYPDVSIRAKQRAADGKMYLVHLAYLGQEAPAIKDLASSVKESLGIAAGEASGARAFPPPSEKRLYLSDTPPDKFFDTTKNMDETPKPGTEQAPGPGEGSGAAGGGGDSAKTSKEVTMTEEEAKKLREENERLKAENDAKELALSDASNRQKATDRERLKAAMDGRIPRVHQDKVFALSEALEPGKVIELSDSEAPEGKRKTSPRDLLIEVISALPLPVEPGVLTLSDASEPANTGRIDYSKI
jgi:hypothetical protein